MLRCFGDVQPSFTLSASGRCAKVGTVGGMREYFNEQLDAVVDEMVAMTTTVQAAVALATQALLEADPAAAEEVIAGDKSIDDVRERIEESSFELLALQQPVAGDLRMLVATLRIVSDLERMGDLAVHVAKIARMRMPDKAVPATLRPTIANMAETAERMVGETARIIADRDVDAARALEAEDEEMDRLRRSMFRILLDEEWEHGVEPAIDLALLGRYYERIADHAVSMARRVIYLVTGSRASQPVQ
jgi:phosphate transport system protein